MEFRQRATPMQFKIIVDFMEMHGDLSRVLPGLQGRLRSESLWIELTDLLNSLGNCGIQKSVDKWKKVWSDYKAKTKKKAVSIDRVKPLNSLEERVLRIIRRGSSTGNQGVEEASHSSEYVTPPPTQPAQRSPPGPAVSGTRFKLEAPCTPEPCSIEVLNEASTHHAAPVNSNTGRLEDAQSSPSAGPPPRRRRHKLGARSRRQQTPFDRATSEFVRVEDRRLRQEESRIRMQHKKDMEKLRVASQRNEILERIADIAHNIRELLTQSVNQ